MIEKGEKGADKIKSALIFIFICKSCQLQGSNP